MKQIYDLDKTKQTSNYIHFLELSQSIASRIAHFKALRRSYKESNPFSKKGLTLVVQVLILARLINIYI